MDATRAARGPGEIRIRRAHGAVKPVRSWWTGLAGNRGQCTTHRARGQPTAGGAAHEHPRGSLRESGALPAGVPPALCTSGRVPPAQRHDECGGPRRFGPRRRGPGAPAAARPVAPRQERQNVAAHRRAAGPGPAADAVWCGGPAAAALVAEARAPARPHEYYSEVEFGPEEAAAEAEGGAAE